MSVYILMLILSLLLMYFYDKYFSGLSKKYVLQQEDCFIFSLEIKYGCYFLCYLWR